MLYAIQSLRKEEFVLGARPQHGVLSLRSDLKNKVPVKVPEFKKQPVPRRAASEKTIRDLENAAIKSLCMLASLGDTEHGVRQTKWYLTGNRREVKAVIGKLSAKKGGIMYEVSNGQEYKWVSEASARKFSTVIDEIVGELVEFSSSASVF